MIRSIWTVVTTLALANLLVILGLTLWLGISGRLTTDRFERVREMLKETALEELDRLEIEAEELAAAELAELEAKKAMLPPISSEDRLALQSQHDAVMQQSLERTRRTLDDMRRTLELERTELDRSIAEFRAEKEAFEQMRERIAQIEGDAQFGKALTLYQSLQPKDAANTLKELYDRGDVEQVVAYLNSMESRKASKVVAQFEPAVAADLLERLRTRGLVAAVPEGR